VRVAGDVAILSTGGILSEGVADRVTADGVKTGVYSVPVIQRWMQKRLNLLLANAACC
jgi:hypothetical protein